MNALSLKEIGELTGLAYNTLSSITTNEDQPRMDTFLLLCSTMDAEPQQFFKESKNAK